MGFMSKQVVMDDRVYALLQRHREGVNVIRRGFDVRDLTLQQVLELMVYTCAVDSMEEIRDFQPMTGSPGRPRLSSGDGKPESTSDSRR